MLACQYLVHIPADPEYSSLNLAQAVQVVSYEVFLTSQEREKPQMRLEKPATVADLEGLYGHLEQAAIESEFYKLASGSKLPMRLRRLFSRVPNLEREEVNILRGLLNALQEPRSK
jgi:tRNA C32,U32 (ribose-2'-O)-methylase TrmJ